MNTDSVPAGPHGVIWELIPWLVNGRLSGEEAAPVRAHIESCADCAREYAQQLCIFEAMQADDSIAFASEAAFQKLAARLDAAPAPALRRTHTPAVRWLVAASILVALGLAAWGGWTVRQTPGATAAPYVTLTAPQAATAGGAQLRVVFSSKLTLDELERLLHSIDAYISDGPSEAGVFTLTLAPGRDSATAVAQRLAALRADANVRFAEPVTGAP
ncbi:MAG TPA: zf-HC2 domain-containing protein [Steroidobacteraceae bacterium]